MTTTTIGFHPSVPCSTIVDADGHLCGKEATVGTLYPMGGGQYILQPFCRDCTQKLVQVYAGELFPPPSDRAPLIGPAKRQAEPSDDDRSGWIERASRDGRP